MLHLRSKSRQFVVLALLLIASMSLTSCASRQGTGLLVGGGGGALIGQAIGGNTKSTLLGAGIGAAVGLLTASASETHHHHREVEVRRYKVKHKARRPIDLRDSRWEAIYHRGEFEGAEALILEFQGDDVLVIKANFDGGKTERYEGHFEQSGSTLAISDEAGVRITKIAFRRGVLDIRGENFRARLREI